MRLLRPTSGDASLRYSKVELASASRAVFIPVVGLPGAGKSSYVQRLLSNAFVWDQDPSMCALPWFEPCFAFSRHSDRLPFCARICRSHRITADYYELLYEVGSEVIRVILLDTVQYEEYCSISPRAQCGPYKVDALLVLHEMHDSVPQPRHVHCKNYISWLEQVVRAFSFYARTLGNTSTRTFYYHLHTFHYVHAPLHSRGADSSFKGEQMAG